MSPKKLIVIAVVILILLIFFTLLLSNLMHQGTSQQQTLIVPTAFSDNNQFGNTNSPQSKSSVNSLTPDQLQRFQVLVTKTPVSTDSYNLEYSPSSGDFFIIAKNSNAIQDWQQYLKDQGVWDLYQKHPELFILTDQNLNETSEYTSETNSQVEQGSLQSGSSQGSGGNGSGNGQSGGSSVNNGGSNNGGSVNNSSGESQNQSSNQVLSPQQTSNDGTTNKDAQSFVNFVQSAMNLDFSDEITIQPIEGVQGPGNGGSGGGNGGGGSGGGGGGNNSYQNPLRSARSLVSGRVDEGVDYAGFGPVYAVGNGQVVLYMNGNSGWPGGHWISYKLLDGPAQGFYVYVAEDCALNTNLHVGSTVNSNTVLCTMGPWIEAGWAVSNADLAISHNYYCVHCSTDGTAMHSGLNFSDFMKYIGGPPGNPTKSTNWPSQGTDPLPAGLPKW